MNYMQGDIVAVQLGEFEQVLVRILEVHEEHYDTFEYTLDEDHLPKWTYGELYKDQDNNYLVLPGDLRVLSAAPPKQSQH